MCFVPPPLPPSPPPQRWKWGEDGSDMRKRRRWVRTFFTLFFFFRQLLPLSRMHSWDETTTTTTGGTNESWQDEQEEREREREATFVLLYYSRLSIYVACSRKSFQYVIVEKKNWGKSSAESIRHSTNQEMTVEPTGDMLKHSMYSSTKRWLYLYRWRWRLCGSGAKKRGGERGGGKS